MWNTKAGHRGRHSAYLCVGEGSEQERIWEIFWDAGYVQSSDLGVHYMLEELVYFAKTQTDF